MVKLVMVWGRGSRVGQNQKDECHTDANRKRKPRKFGDRDARQKCAYHQRTKNNFGAVKAEIRNDTQLYF